MLTITRRLARELVHIFRRAFGHRGQGPAVVFTVAAGTLNVAARFADVAVAYRGADAGGDDETFGLPLESLETCAGNSDAPVQLQCRGGQVSLQWRDGDVPQLLAGDADVPVVAETPLGGPEDYAENPPALLPALAAASETTDPAAVQYALGCLRLRGGDGSLAASDGRQLLVQRGFRFPWNGDLLVPRNRVFAAAALPHDQPLHVGRAAERVVLKVGAWTFWLGIHEGRPFPTVEQHLPTPAEIAARWRFSAEDAAQLRQVLPQLPRELPGSQGVTIELNGQVVVRARAADQPVPTEIVLAHASCTGERLRLSTNRTYLARALKLGFREFAAARNGIVLVGHDATRDYAWALLNPESAVAPTDDTTGRPSPAEASTASRPQPPRRLTRMRKTKIAASPPPSAPTNGHAVAPAPQCAGRPSPPVRRRPPPAVDLMVAAEQFRRGLRDLLRQANQLVTALRQQRRQDRLLQTTLANLRQIKTLKV